MFVLYAVAGGLLVGLLTGGRWTSLGSLRIRWSLLIVLAIVLQVALFAEPIAGQVGTMGPLLYVGSTALVIAAVARNLAVRGMPLVLAGALSNMTAVLVNGGYMPASQSALDLAGRSVPTVYSNSSSAADPALWPLTDVLALPGWMPLANVFSLGDALIGLGIAAIVVLTMRNPASEPAPARVSGRFAWRGGARTH